LEQVTQQNAASAEESASVSHSMARQSDVMRDVVDRLIVLVGDNRK
jgi:methyl-accepting chemotaxis protein